MSDNIEKGALGENYKEGVKNDLIKEKNAIIPIYNKTKNDTFYRILNILWHATEEVEEAWKDEVHNYIHEFKRGIFISLWDKYIINKGGRMEVELDRINFLLEKKIVLLAESEIDKRAINDPRNALQWRYNKDFIEKLKTVFKTFLDSSDIKTVNIFNKKIKTLIKENEDSVSLQSKNIINVDNSKSNNDYYDKEVKKILKQESFINIKGIHKSRIKEFWFLLKSYLINIYDNKKSFEDKHFSSIIGHFPDYLFNNFLNYDYFKSESKYNNKFLISWEIRTMMHLN